MSDELETYSNPFFYNNLESDRILKGNITYNKTYPFVDLPNKILNAGDIESEIDNISLLDAKKRAIKYPLIIGFYFQSDIGQIHIDETIGKGVFYVYDPLGIEVISKNSDGGINRYSLYLKKNDARIPESVELTTDDDDYMGELDYVTISINNEDIEKIKEMSVNLDSSIESQTGDNKPIYMNGTFEREKHVGSGGQDNFHIVEYYLYCWEEINSPWFHNNGRTANFTPNIEQVSDDEGNINCKGSNIYNLPTTSFANDKISNPQDDREGYKLYTQNNTTGDFVADTSSNYVKIYRLIGSNSDAGTNGLPLNTSINILTPKYSRFYFFWTYRINLAGKLILHDFPEDTVSGVGPREIPISGTFPYFTPGVDINQSNLRFLSLEFQQGNVRPIQTRYVPWQWSYLNFTNWGLDINHFETIDVIRQYKPQNAPILSYLNQHLKIEIPEQDIQDLFKNFIDRFNPNRETPRFKTIDGDIYIHPYEYNQILHCGYDIYVFKNKTEHPVEDNDGNQLLLYGERGREIESITETFTISMHTRPNDQIIPFNRMTIKELTDPSGNELSSITLIQGNRYIFDLSDPELLENNVAFNIKLLDYEPKNGTWEYYPNYKNNLTFIGTQGNDGQIIFNVPLNGPRRLYLYNIENHGIEIIINIITNNEETRNFADTESSYPYIDKYTNILSDETHHISNNLQKVITFQDSNFDFFDVPLDERGDWAYKDNSGNNASKLYDDDREGAMTEFANDTWFGFEEYTPDNVQILRPYLVDLKTYPYHVHILNTAPGDGWSTKWKGKEMFPQTREKIIPIDTGEYYVRWSFNYHRYRYDRTRRFDPRYLSWEDISFNNGISPYSYFDYREYGKIFPPRELNIEYSRIEYPDQPEKYYKNLRFTVPGEQLVDLETNIIYNTDLGAEISLQFYIIKPKNRLDRNQNDPIIDISSYQFTDYDLSYNLQPLYGQRFPQVAHIDISDNEIIGETLRPGRFFGVWSYTVNHSYININSREYPLIPNIDYFAIQRHIDISYNEFLYDNIEPIYRVPDDLTRLQLEISKTDIQGVVNMWERYYKGLLSDETYMEFWFLMYSPNYEHTQLLSGQNRWELPNDFTGDEDPRLYQTPINYEDTTQIVTMKKVWLGNDNSDSSGAIYNWGYGGEPGIQFRKGTYEDISHNELYNYKYGILDISSGNINLKAQSFDISEVIQFEANDISNTNFMIEFYLPARTEPYDMYRGYLGFNNDPDRMCDTDLTDSDSRGNFHIGINGNGADTIVVEETVPPFVQEAFIYKPPFDPEVRTTQQHYVRYRLDHSIDNVLRYHFFYTPTRGTENGKVQTGQQDVRIYLNDEKIYDFPNWGITLDQITHVGQNYDASRNPIIQNNVQVKFLFPIENAKQIKLVDISNTSVVINTLVPQDFDEMDTETSFYESQNYVTDGLYIPYVTRWFYKIRDPITEQYLESSIMQTEYPNEMQRMADWQIKPLDSGGEEIVKSPSYPFEHFYKYAIFYAIPKDFIAPLPFYPTQTLDLSYNEITSDLIVTFDYERIVYPLLYNLNKYWRHEESKTKLTYTIFAWYPNSDKLPDNYSNVNDIAHYHLWEDVYDISFDVVSPSPYTVANIMPSIPYNIFTIGKEQLIYGKWVLAWNYKVENYAYRALDRQRPDYIFFDVSASEINIPPILYNPQQPILSYITKDENNNDEKIKIKIKEKEILDLSRNVFYQLRGLNDISGIKINYYLWTPNKEITYDPSGWEIANNYYGRTDQRLYGAPVLYETSDNYDTGNYNVYFNEPDEGEFGYKISKALKKSVYIDASGGDLMDASCVYFTSNEINNLDVSGNIIYSDKHKKRNLHKIPYISRWSYEIVRNNNLPSYYSDISDNIYYRKPSYEVITNNLGYKILKDYTKINRYIYGVLYVDTPEEEPTLIILDDEGLCSCPDNLKSITKTQEKLNYKMRIKTMLQNFRFAKRLRPRPASMDPRAKDYSGNYIFKYKNDPCL
tara:strand:- start:1214 stop:7138 length:5925 start_codon:yes stop_codon:yes gene_type:complete